MRIAPGRAESVSRQTVKKQNKNKQNKTHTHTHTNNQQQKTVLGFVSSSFVLSWGFLRRSEVAKHAALLTQILRWLGTGNAEIQVPSAADLMHASPTARKSASPPHFAFMANSTSFLPSPLQAQTSVWHAERMRLCLVTWGLEFRHDAIISIDWAVHVMNRSIIVQFHGANDRQLRSFFYRRMFSKLPMTYMATSLSTTALILSVVVYWA